MTDGSDIPLEHLRKPFRRYDATFEPGEFEKPTTLFHYTDADGFAAILKTQSLLLGRLSAMNDTKEHSWLRELAAKIADERWQALYYAAPDKPPDDEWAMTFYTTLKYLLGDQVNSDPYCSCFSVRGDLLSQWRAYAAQATGFAIGFDPNALAIGGDNPVEVEYKPEKHRNRVESLFNVFTELRGNLEQAVFNAEIVHDKLLGHAMFCKNEHFEEEQEYRVVVDACQEPGRVLVPDSVHTFRADPAKAKLKPYFAVRRGHILQYLRLPFMKEFGRKSINQIVLGPRNPARNNPEVLRRFLLHYKYSHLYDQVFESAGTLR